MNISLIEIKEDWSKEAIMAWLPESDKPYDVPEGLKIKFEQRLYPRTGKHIKIAVIEQSKEQKKEATQEDLLNEILNDASSTPMNLWYEVVNRAKSKFRIERI